MNSIFEMETKGTNICISVILQLALLLIIFERIYSMIRTEMKRLQKYLAGLFASGNSLIFVCRKVFVTFEMVHKFCLLQFRNYTLGRPSEIT